MPLHASFAFGLLAFFSTFAPNISAQAFSNVAYGTDPEETLDVYLPPNIVGRPPIVVEIHGGGWSTGTKGQFFIYNPNTLGVGMIERFLNRGVAVVSINYPLTVEATSPQFPKNIHPAAANSVRKAFQFVRANAGSWGLNPLRVGMIGGSAGGHLGLLAAMSDDLADPNDPNPTSPAHNSSRPDWAVCCWTPVSVTKQHLVSPVLRPAQWLLFGKATKAQFNLVPDAITQSASPVHVAPKNDFAVKRQIPMLGIYTGDATKNKVSDYAWPTADPHGYQWWVLMAQALAPVGSSFTAMETIVRSNLAADADNVNTQVADWVSSRTETPLALLPPSGVAPDPTSFRFAVSADLGSLDAVTWLTSSDLATNQLELGLWVNRDPSSGQPDVYLQRDGIMTLVSMGYLQLSTNGGYFSMTSIPFDMNSLGWNSFTTALRVTKDGFPQVLQFTTETRT